MYKRIIFVVLFVLGLFTSNIIFPAVKINVSGIPSVRGKIRLGVYKSQEDFKNKKEYRGIIADVTDHSVIIELKDLEPGWYMIAVYHDANDNQEMDALFFGPPVEAYGFSNNAKGFFGPAKFKDAKFYYDGNGTQMNIKLGGI